MPNILVVCTANICRSPVGEVVLRDRLNKQGLTDWKVASAGTWAEPDRNAAAFSRQLMAAQGFDLEGHRSRMVSEENLAAADLVLVMETGHAEALRAEFPQYANKVYLLSEMAGPRYSVTDPYGGPLEAYQEMVAELTTLIEKGLPRIMQLAQANRVNV
jgi:protein-tyrosine-phosphatase